MLTVIAEIRTRPGQHHRQAVLDQFAKIVPVVLQEEGCHGYEPLVALVKHSTMCTRCEARAGGTPSTPTSSVFMITPNAMPSAPSTSCAAKPTPMNGNRAQRSKSPKFIPGALLQGIEATKWPPPERSDTQKLSFAKRGRFARGET